MLRRLFRGSRAVLRPLRFGWSLEITSVVLFELCAARLAEKVSPAVRPAPTLNRDRGANPLNAAQAMLAARRALYAPPTENRATSRGYEESCGKSQKHPQHEQPDDLPWSHAASDNSTIRNHRVPLVNAGRRTTMLSGRIAPWGYASAPTTCSAFLQIINILTLFDAHLLVIPYSSNQRCDAFVTDSAAKINPRHHFQEVKFRRSIAWRGS